MRTGMRLCLRTALPFLVIAGAIGGVALQAVNADAAPTWSIVPSPNPTGVTSLGEPVGSSVFLYGVSCVNATNCTAVGSYDIADFGYTLVKSWNGSAWSIVASPNPSGGGGPILTGVSCVSATNCTAVGERSEQLLVESWNGSAWSIVSSPDPSGSSGADFQGVSCISAANCTAVGSSYNGSTFQTLVESWNGSAWSIVPSPNPSGSTDNVLYGVSCVNATNCTAVGQFTVASTSQTLVESWNGSAWSISPQPQSE